MLKKFLGVLTLSGLLLSGAYADDILSIVSKGQLTSKSAGVKELSLEEKMQVKGGYAIGYTQISQNEIAVLALPDFENELGWEIKNGQIDLAQTANNDRGLCAIGVTQCYSNSATKKHLWQSQNRLQAFTQALDNSNPLYTALGFSVKRNIGSGRYGRFVYFTYGVVAVNRINGSVRNVTTSSALNNNIIINELKNNYKEHLETALGGYYIK